MILSQIVPDPNGAARPVKRFPWRLDYPISRGAAILAGDVFADLNIDSSFRFIDHIQKRPIQTKQLVLDRARRIAELGFDDQQCVVVEKIEIRLCITHDAVVVVVYPLRVVELEVVRSVPLQPA